MEKPRRGRRAEIEPPMRIRRAKPGDYRDIEALMHALELSYPEMDLSCFWVAEDGSGIVAAAELKDFRDCSLLSCVGVRQDLQRLGIGRILVEEVVRHAHHDIYLYTLVPGFFRKAGFTDAQLLPSDLPSRSIYGCEDCNPRLCFCLVRLRHDS
jgi:N-acetylglutamate synthase-like GNAT family acetyltransferase